MGNTSTRVDLNWIPPLHPNGVIHYKIEFSLSENFVQNKTIINTGSNKTYYILSGLRLIPDVQYFVRVVACNSVAAEFSNILEWISTKGT